jgi:hypothetical protein
VETFALVKIKLFFYQKNKSERVFLSFPSSKSSNFQANTMAEGNGEYNNYSEPDSNDFKRKLQSENDAETAISDEGLESGGMTEKANNYIRELLSERELIRQHNLDPPPSIKVSFPEREDKQKMASIIFRLFDGRILFSRPFSLNFSDSHQ